MDHKVKNTIKIRSATESDYSEWYSLWQRYQTFYKIEIPLEISKETWRRLLDPKEDMHLALAEIDEKIVGLTHFVEHSTTWNLKKSIYLQDLYVNEDCRGKGVGRLLIEYVYEHSKKIGSSEVHWLTHITNLQAMALYDKIALKTGFLEYSKSFD